MCALDLNYCPEKEKKTTNLNEMQWESGRNWDDESDHEFSLLRALKLSELLLLCHKTVAEFIAGWIDLNRWPELFFRVLFFFRAMIPIEWHRLAGSRSSSLVPLGSTRKFYTFRIALPQKRSKNETRERKKNGWTIELTTSSLYLYWIYRKEVLDTM